MRLLFMTAKIQIFESNSQQLSLTQMMLSGCLWPQRYKFLKAIHNGVGVFICIYFVVYDRKDTNFWKQFTTRIRKPLRYWMLFMTAKIQIFESNSQRKTIKDKSGKSCLWPQRYKFLKAIHNETKTEYPNRSVVYDRKDTNFWKQFTTKLLNNR